MIGRRLMRQPAQGPSSIFDVPGTRGAYWSADPVHFVGDLNSPLDAWKSLNSDIQAVATVKPILRKTKKSQIYWVDSVAASDLKVVFPEALGSNCTVVRSTDRGVEFFRGLTIGLEYVVARYFNFNSDILVCNRPLSVFEESMLREYMQRRIPMLGPDIVLNGRFDTDVDEWGTDDLPEISLSWNNGRLQSVRSVVGQMYTIQRRPEYFLEQGSLYVARLRNRSAAQVMIARFNHGVTAQTSAIVMPAMTSIPAGTEVVSVAYAQAVSRGVLIWLGTNQQTNTTLLIDDVSWREIL